MKYRQNKAATVTAALPAGPGLGRRQRRPTAEPAHALYGDALERVWHQRSIKALADTTAQPVLVIVPMYEEVLAQMRPTARLKEYLPIFVSRRVRRMLAS